MTGGPTTGPRFARARTLTHALACALGLLAGSATQARAQGDSLHARATVTPGIAKLGERVFYRGEVVLWAGGRAQWLSPEQAPDLTWGSVRYGTARPHEPGQRFGQQAATPRFRADLADTAWIEIPLQAFEPGVRRLPGLEFRVIGAPGMPPEAPRRLPQVNLIVTSTLTAADSSKGLRDVHGPLVAPWWERVAWRWVAAIAALVAVVLMLFRWLRRRKPAPPVTVAAPVSRDPTAEALGALRALRAQQLPEQNRFAEHAFALGQILRRFLEATVTLARPGDTTPELVAHLRGAGLPADDVQRLTALLRVWDRVKFARESMSVDEATRTEAAVESHVRGTPGSSSGRVA